MWSTDACAANRPRRAVGEFGVDDGVDARDRVGDALARCEVDLDLGMRPR